MNKYRLAILGCGTMGEAILTGLLEAGLVEASSVLAIVRRKERAAELSQKYKINASLNGKEVQEAKTIIVCLKPQNVEIVLKGLELQNKLLISICAGISISNLQNVTANCRVIRAMPNTPSLIREGMSAISPDKNCNDYDINVARKIFSAIGRCRVIEEKHLDAITGLSGSGPAFVCVVLEALADGGVMMGLPREVAVEFAAQTMQGTARLVLESGEHPAALKDQVTTPAGCTIAGLLMMEDGKIRSTLARTIQEATKVASNLGRKKS